MSATTIGAALIFVILGYLEPKDFVNNFANDTVVMLEGAMVVAAAVDVTGGAKLLGTKILKLVGHNERRVLIVTMILGFGLSMFCSNAASMAMLMPVLGAVAAASNGDVKPKHIAIPIGLCVWLGGGATMVGSAVNAVTQGVLQENGWDLIGMFDMCKWAVPCVILVILYFSTVGWKFLVKTTEDVPEFDFKSFDNGEELKVTPKMLCAYAALIIMILGFATGKLTNGAVAWICVVICLMAGCIQPKEAYKKIEWNSLFIIIGCLSVAKVLVSTGTAQFVADTIVGLLGESAGMLAIAIVCILLIASIGSLISHTSTLTMFVPLFLPVAATMGFSPTALGIALTCASSCAFLTPLCGASYSCTFVYGYRMKDYVKLGLVPMIMCVIVDIAIYAVIM